jgi:hypothetical protein
MSVQWNLYSTLLHQPRPSEATVSDPRTILCCGTGTENVGTVTFCRVEPEPELIMVPTP